MGREAMRITVLGFLAIAAAIIAAVLLLFHLSEANRLGPEQSYA